MYGVRRDFPNAEKAQNVVNAVSVEVFRHFAETFHPPRITVLLHYVPVVGGETPVLTVYREIIGRCPRLAVQVEVIGFRPCFYTVAADADGNITFQHYAVGACMFRCCQQLQVQVELDEEVDGNVRIVGRIWLT